MLYSSHAPPSYYSRTLTLFKLVTRLGRDDKAPFTKRRVKSDCSTSLKQSVEKLIWAQPDAPEPQRTESSCAQETSFLCAFRKKPRENIKVAYSDKNIKKYSKKICMGPAGFEPATFSTSRKRHATRP